MTANETFSHKHPVKHHRDWCIVFNNKHQCDPGNSKCQQHIAWVIKDLVSRYDLDGIHLDDYFYHYLAANKPFNDSLSFNKYRNADFESLNLADWRRQNVNQTV